MNVILSHLPPLSALPGLLPLAALPLGLLAALSRDRPPRFPDAMTGVALVWGIVVWSVSEALGWFGVLHPAVLLPFWAVADAVLLVLLILRRRWLSQALHACRPPSWALALFPLLAATAATALLVPPNTWDTLCYHLSRVEFWLQRGSVSFYPTAEPRQLFSQPFAEIAILHIHALAGGDWFDGLVQWSAHVGCIAIAGDLAWTLSRGNRVAVAVAAFFSATLPIALLEASTCQNDLVVAFWLLAAARTLPTLPQRRGAMGFPAFGAAVGLALLSKGSAYPLLLPFAGGAAVVFFCSPRRRFMPALLAVLTVLLINTPHWIRNTSAFGDPFGGQAASFRPPLRPSSLVATIWCGFASNLHPLCESGTRRATGMLLETLGVDPADRSVFFPGCNPLQMPHEWFHRDTAPNPLHTLLLLAAAIAIAARSSRWRPKKENRFRCDPLALSALFCLIAGMAFVGCIRWQTWITRLQTPLFLLCAAPFGAFVSQAKRPVVVFLCGILAIAALPAAFCSSERSILPCSWEGRCTIRNAPREHLYFAGRRIEYTRYSRAAKRIALARPRVLAIVGRGGAWDYPIFPMLRARMGKGMPTICHVKEAEADYFEAVLRISPVSPSVSLWLADKNRPPP